MLDNKKEHQFVSDNSKHFGVDKYVIMQYFFIQDHCMCQTQLVQKHSAGLNVFD